jgi:hypothetical protein
MPLVVIPGIGPIELPYTGSGIQGSQQNPLLAQARKRASGVDAPPGAKRRRVPQNNAPLPTQANAPDSVAIRRAQQVLVSGTRSPGTRPNLLTNPSPQRSRISIPPGTTTLI